MLCFRAFRVSSLSFAGSKSSVDVGAETSCRQRFLVHWLNAENFALAVLVIMFVIVSRQPSSNLVW